MHRFETSIRKVQAKEHGRITPQYVEYCHNDVRATYELTKAMKAEYATYHLDLPATELYSPAATLGKVYLKPMDVESFFLRNPPFPRDVLGYAMECFYGGRSEVRIRKTRFGMVIDFLSMYPTMCILQDIWKYVIAFRIETHDDTTR